MQARWIRGSGGSMEGGDVESEQLQETLRTTNITAQWMWKYLYTEKVDICSYLLIYSMQDLLSIVG